MKKYIVIGLIVLVGGALLIGPLLGDDPEIPTNDGGATGTPIPEKLPATFSFSDNLAATCNSNQSIDVVINEKDIAQLVVDFDGVSIESWENPTTNVSFSFTVTKVGTYSFDLIATMKDGKQIKDERSLRVVSDIKPKRLKAKIIKPFSHNETSFTQGLEFEGGKLYEGTGLRGVSKVMEVNLETGESLRQQGLDANYFGEGITILNDKLYQLTWERGKCFVYDLQTLQILNEDKNYVGQGWGLCNNGTELIMSDGTENIYFRDPETFQEIRRIQVFSDEGPIPQLNELEYIDGKIYANVYQTNVVVSIDPETGKVFEIIQCNELVSQGRGSGVELNGIAQNDVDGKIYLTGKKWPLLFEVEFVPDAIQ
jgi:glutamine cyclotransferase